MQTQPPQIHSQEEKRGIILMSCSVLLFSTTALLLSYVHDRFGVSGWVASAYRALMGLILVHAMQSRTGKVRLSRVFTQPLLFARGFIGGMTIPVYYITIMQLGPGRAGMIGGSYPLFAALFAMCFLGERVSRKDFAYMGLALLGLVGVFASNGIEASKPLFDVVALCGAAAAGVCVVLIRHLRHSETTSNIFAAQCVFALILGVIGARSELFIPDPQVFGLVLLASVIVVAAQLCLTAAFRHIEVAKGSTMQMMTPVCTAVSSALLLGESFGLFEIIGGAAILFASYRIVMRKHKS